MIDAYFDEIVLFFFFFYKMYIRSTCQMGTGVRMSFKDIMWFHSQNDLYRTQEEESSRNKNTLTLIEVSNFKLHWSQYIIPFKNSFLKHTCDETNNRNNPRCVLQNQKFAGKKKFTSDCLSRGENWKKLRNPVSSCTQ